MALKCYFSILLKVVVCNVMWKHIIAKKIVSVDYIFHLNTSPFFTVTMHFGDDDDTTRDENTKSRLKSYSMCDDIVSLYSFLHNTEVETIKCDVY